jgi:hypothetical protein
MPSGRNTVSRDKLTDLDTRALEISRDLSKSLADSIPSSEDKKAFAGEYGTISLSRDAGYGRGGGKLQRDALCTRGRGGKNPYSNRNLRWHPLIVAHETPKYAKELDEVRIRNKKLFFVANGESFGADEVYRISESTPYCASYPKWQPLINELRGWEINDWQSNGCVIPALEYAPRNHSIETFAVLGLIVVSSFYRADLDRTYSEVVSVLKSKLGGIGAHGLSTDFPTEDNLATLVLCPLCKARIVNRPADLQFPARSPIWQPTWMKAKRGEGEAESLQITHTRPLIERETVHTARNVRYGHRWCNVAMTDHSVDETLRFFTEVVKAHNQGTQARPSF